MRGTYLADIRRTYRNYRAIAEGAIAQVSDAGLTTTLDADGNSIEVVMHHVAGTLRSRFARFLTQAGETPERDRDGEFEPRQEMDRVSLMAEWHAAWDMVLGELDSLTPHDLERTVHIRGEAFAVVEALQRSVTHTAYHVGQIVLLAKHLAGATWISLSIPKGQAARFGTGTFKTGIVPSRSSNR